MHCSAFILESVFLETITVHLEILSWFCLNRVAAPSCFRHAPSYQNADFPHKMLRLCQKTIFLCVQNGVMTPKIRKSCFVFTESRIVLLFRSEPSSCIWASCSRENWSILYTRSAPFILELFFFLYYFYYLYYYVMHCWRSLWHKIFNDIITVAMLVWQ